LGQLIPVLKRFAEIAVKDSAHPGSVASQDVNGPCPRNSK